MWQKKIVFPEKDIVAIPMSNIKVPLVNRQYVSEFVEKYHPGKTVKSPATVIFNDTAQVHFCNISKTKKKQTSPKQSAYVKAEKDISKKPKLTLCGPRPLQR